MELTQPIQRHSARIALLQRNVLDQALRDIEDLRIELTTTEIVPQRSLVEFHRRLQAAQEELRRVRNLTVMKGEIQ